MGNKRRNDGRPRRSRQEAESGEEDSMDLYKSAEQVHEELEMRQASREEVKAVLRAVMQLSAGMHTVYTPCLQSTLRTLELHHLHSR